jgi:transcriptional regulator with XRE-family HTH domain
MVNKMMGARIKDLRRALNMNATELAELVGVTQTQISRLETGKQELRSETLTKIAQALQVHPAWFFMEPGPEGVATYSAIVHPNLGKALFSPRFLMLLERMAEIQDQDPKGFREIVRAIDELKQDELPAPAV